MSAYPKTVEEAAQVIDRFDGQFTMTVKNHRALATRLRSGLADHERAVREEERADCVAFLWQFEKEYRESMGHFPPGSNPRTVERYRTRANELAVMATTIAGHTGSLRDFLPHDHPLRTPSASPGPAPALVTCTGCLHNGGPSPKGDRWCVCKGKDGAYWADKDAPRECAEHKPTPPASPEPVPAATEAGTVTAPQPPPDAGGRRCDAPFAYRGGMVGICDRPAGHESPHQEWLGGEWQPDAGGRRLDPDDGDGRHCGNCIDHLLLTTQEPCRSCRDHSHFRRPGSET